MNLSKELKKKRDAEARLNKQSPEPTFSSNGTTETYIDISGLALKSEIKDEIVELNDVDITLTGNAGKFLKVNATGTGIDLGTGGGADDFLDLTDTPSAYTGEGGKIVAVKATADGLEFVSAPAATNGIPTGGTAGQIIEKVDGTDYNVQWTDAPAASNGLPTGGTADQILSKIDGTNYNTQWVDAPSGGGSLEVAFTKPTITDFDASRAGTGTLSDVTNGVRLVAPGTTSNVNSLIYLVKNVVEGVNGYRATARIRRHTPLEKWGMMGLILRNSSDGKSVVYGLGNDNRIGFNRNTFSNDTTWASVAGIVNYNELDFWIRVHDDLTTRKIFISRYGDYWQQIFSEAHDTYCAPNQVGVFINPNFGDSTAVNVRAETGIDVFSWLFESL